MSMLKGLATAGNTNTSRQPCSSQSDANKAELSTNVRKALYASKICSYAQGLNIIRAKSIAMGWNIEMGELTRIWKVCIPCAIWMWTCIGTGGDGWLARLLPVEAQHKWTFLQVVVLAIGGLAYCFLCTIACCCNYYRAEYNWTNDQRSNL